MPRKLDVAVCGCGPAGLAAAQLLYRLGHRVRIFERFESPRPVGSGLILQPTGLAVLKELGLLERIAALGARIEKLFGRAVPSGRVVLAVRYSALGVGWQAVAVHRAALFDALGANPSLANGLARRTVLAYGALWVNVPWSANDVFSANALEQRSLPRLRFLSNNRLLNPRDQP